MTTHEEAKQTILDRTLGRAPQHVEIGVAGDTPFERMIAAAVVCTTAQADDVVDGEVVEDD